MKNKEISGILFKISELLNISNENKFKIRAYERAAQEIESLASPIEDIIKSGTKLPGIGDGLTEKIREYLDTGKIKYLDELESQLPEGLLQIIQVPGVGPKKAKLLFDKLGITGVDKLYEFAKAGKLRELPGFGEKTEQNILSGIEFRQKTKGRILLDEADGLADAIISRLKKNRAVKQISAAGSLRRKKETIGDIDILCAAEKGNEEKIIDEFTRLPEVSKVSAKGTAKSSIITRSGIQADLRVVDSSQYGAAMQYFTGSKEHNVLLREYAVRKGYSINEYGIFKSDNKNKAVGGEKEEDIYKVLKLQYIPPELRENRGELEAAKSNQLPALVQNKDIKGDMHVHSTYSDGHNTIEEIANKAEQLGYEWVIICDHSQSLRVAHGLSETDLRRKIDEIRNINKKSKIKVLAGTEVDILSDGSIDYPDSALKELDFVICGIHTGFKQSEQQIADRVKKAFSNRYVHSMSHPSGRLLLARDAYAVDINKLIEYASANSVALEINAHPQRLDLSDIYCKKAKETGVKFTVGSDAHYVNDMEYMKYGIFTAQRGWLEKNDIINTLLYSELLKFLRSKR